MLNKKQAVFNGAILLLFVTALCVSILFVWKHVPRQAVMPAPKSYVRATVKTVIAGRPLYRQTTNGTMVFVRFASGQKPPAGYWVEGY